MDISVFVMLLVFSLTLTVLGFMGNRAGWAFLIFIGAFIAFLTAEVLLVDGDLTQTTTAVQVLASANGDFLSDFNVISIVPICIGTGEAVVAIRRIFRI